MIQFNKLEFINCKTLHLNAHVLSLSYYNNVYITGITIDTEDTVCESGPSNNAPLRQIISGRPKYIDTTIDVSALVENGPKMLFVYIECDGVPASTTPCGLDNQNSMHAVVDYGPLYETALKLAQCTSKCGCSDGSCEIDVVFANFALQYFRLKACLENEKWSDAYDAYRFLMKKGKGKNGQTLKAPCGCNG